MRFGIFDHVERRNDVGLAQQYEERLQFAATADAAGFYCYHVAEHHHSPLCLAPNQAVYLAAVAQRTKRLRLSTLVYVLPLHNPIRLIEEICLIDQLSNGRFEVGVGRGSDGRDHQGPASRRGRGRRSAGLDGDFSGCWQVLSACPGARTRPTRLHAPASGRENPHLQNCPRRRTQAGHRALCRSQKLDGVTRRPRPGGGTSAPRPGAGTHDGRRASLRRHREPVHGRWHHGAVWGADCT
jgi:alkanesulfonate monooxygenase SsuD/methylene tetrahydromethanopterin reductase-like flavin-dependent oxidoreductase (luciferase family)